MEPRNEGGLLLLALAGAALVVLAAGGIAAFVLLRSHSFVASSAPATPLPHATTVSRPPLPGPPSPGPTVPGPTVPGPTVPATTVPATTVPGPTVPTLAADPTVAEGALSPAVIRRVVLQHLGEVRLCYEQALQRDPTASGRVTAHFVIGPSGSVASATADGSSDTVLTSCIAGRVRRWVFPAPNGGGTVRVNYPFVFAPT